jgi:Tol biopolymer transport system component
VKTTVGRTVGLLAAMFVLLVRLPQPAAQSGAPSFSEPVNLGPSVNSEFQENSPSVSADGSSLYFGSNRLCGEGDIVLDLNVWVARRSGPGLPWQVECLRINLDGYLDGTPDLTPDGRWLYFSSDRPGSTGTQRDIWVSHREDLRDDQGWSPPVNLGAPVNTNAPEQGSSYFVTREARYFRLLAKQKLMFVRPTSGNFDIWEVNMLDDLPFGSPTRVDEIDTDEFWESGPSVSPDGREMFFQRSVPNGPFDLFISTRREPDLPWSTPVNLGAPINTPASSDAVATRTSDGTLLYFESNRPGGRGSSDIWLATRIGGR